MKTWPVIAIRRVLVLANVLICLVASPLPAFTQSAGHLCAHYTTREEAQTVFDSDPTQFRELDDDRDGIACEHLPSAIADEETSIMPWLAGAGALVVVAGGAGTWSFTRARRQHHAAGPELPLVVAPQDDLAIEIDLATIKARHAAELQGEIPDQAL